jgi:hypothetical protein
VENVQSITGTSPAYAEPGTRGFLAGNPGRPKGIVDKRALSGRQAAQALAAHAWDVVRALCDSEDQRVSLDASKLVLAYAHGQPRATVAVEDLREHTDEYAARYGLNSADVLALASKIAAEDANPS